MSVKKPVKIFLSLEELGRGILTGARDATSNQGRVHFALVFQC